MTKYLLDEFEDSPSQQYAIGTVQLLFSHKLSSVCSGTKVDDRCGAMSVGSGDPNNGRFVFNKISSQN